MRTSQRAFNPPPCQKKKEKSISEPMDEYKAVLAIATDVPWLETG